MGGCRNPAPQLPEILETVSCTGRAAPLVPAQVVRVLRAQGFSVTSSTNSDECQGFAVTESEETPGFAITNTDSSSEPPTGEGTLYCLLRQGPIWGDSLEFDGSAEASSPIFNGPKAEAKFANLECTLYPPEEHPVSRVQALRRGMSTLSAGK